MNPILLNLFTLASAVETLKRDAKSSAEINKAVQVCADACLQAFREGDWTGMHINERNRVRAFIQDISDQFSVLKAKGAFFRLIGTSQTEKAILSVLNNASNQVAICFPSEDLDHAVIAKPSPISFPAELISPMSSATVNFMVYYNTGYGNSLEIRGNGPGMSWDKGIPLRCLTDDNWQISLPVSAKSYEYKIVMKKADGELIWESLPDGKNRIYEAGKQAIPPLTPVIAGRFHTPELNNLYLEGDSLSDTAKANIYKFVRDHLLKEDKELIAPTSKETLLALSKTYKPVNISYSHLVDEYHRTHGHPERTLNRLHEVLKNPLLEASLGLEHTNTEQIYAARIFMKAVICNPSMSLGTIQDLYVRKMAGTGELVGKFPRTTKHMMMGKKAVCELPASPSPIDILLANTRILYQDSDSVDRLRTIFSELLSHEETAHIMYAFALLMQQQKGNILINNSSSSLDGIAAHKNVQRYYGFSCYHSIYLRRLDCSDDGLTFKSLFIHEASHYVFQQLVSNAYSPVSGDQEAVLDEALAKDRDHRKTLPVDILHAPKYLDVIRSLVARLETNPGYFPPSGFDPSNPKHLQTMRIEVIVRIMEQIALGSSLEDIRTIAPHLCDFYFRYSKPMIERHILSGLSALTNVKSSDVTKGTHFNELLTAVYDVGFGNSLEIRGNGPGMSWDKGIPLSCSGADRWRFSTLTNDKPFQYKIVMRKSTGEVIWEEFEGNRTCTPGMPLHFIPFFK